ncbi:MAG: hypothetical protein AAF628_35690 [Planctomycetota bacterium]
MIAALARSIRRTVLLVLAASLASCAAIGVGVSEVSIRTTAPPRFAAWVAAQRCRHTLAEADPTPRHRGAPVLHHGRDRYAVRYARAAMRGDGDWCVAFDARLAWRPDDVAAPSGLRPIELHPTAARRGPAQQHDAVCIDIEPDGRGGTRVRVRQFGSARFSSLAADLRRDLHLAEALATVAHHWETRQLSRLEASARRALTAHPASSAPTDRQIRAALWLARAAAQERIGQMQLARRYASIALAEDPTRHAGRRLRARVHDHLARENACAADLCFLAALPDQSGPALAAQRAWQRAVGAAPGARRFLQGAHERLDTGDPRAALHWIQRAAAAVPQHPDVLRTAAAVHRARGERRRAFETALLELTRDGASPALLLALHDDAAALGDVPGAVSWLLHGAAPTARADEPSRPAWQEIGPAAPAEARLGRATSRGRARPDPGATPSPGPSR